LKIDEILNETNEIRAILADVVKYHSVVKSV